MDDKYDGHPYANYEYNLAKEYIIPRIREVIHHRKMDKLKGMRILDIGCCAGGVTVALAEEGCDCTGIDIDQGGIGPAQDFARIKGVKANFFVDDIFNPTKIHHVKKFDLILLRDVIEHMECPYDALNRIDHLLADRGLLYVEFPPWFSPYGGHQHHSESIVKFIPFSHLLPKMLFMSLISRKDKEWYEEVKQVLKNKVSLARFEKSIEESNYKIIAKDTFLIRPAHKLRMKLPIIRANAIDKVPILREAMITGAEYILSKK